MILHYDVFGNATPEWINEANQMEREHETPIQVVADTLQRQAVAAAAEAGCASERTENTRKRWLEPELVEIRERVKMPAIFSD